MYTAEELKEMLQLEPLTFEGGYFRRTYCAEHKIPPQVLPDGYTDDKALCSTIFYLLTPDTFSEFHSLPTDEVYHFYMGDPVEMIELHPDGECSKTILGQDLRAGQSIQHVVKTGTWQASYLLPGGQAALMGCTMSPAFDQSDYRKGNWEGLLRTHPKHHQLIMKYTRK